MTVSRHGEEQNMNTEEAKNRAIAMIDEAIEGIDVAELDAKIKAHEDAEMAKESWHRHQAMNQRKIDAGIPERYLSASFASWVPEGEPQEKLRSEVQRWKSGPFRDGASAVLRGGVGTGKTWIACGLMADAIEKGYSAVYSTAKAYTGKVKETYRKDAKLAESDVLAHFSDVDLLVLDEIGRQFETHNEHLYLFDLVNERYNRGKPTIFLTNLDGDEFKEFVGDAILDRLKEGGSVILSLNWPSRRGA